MLQVLEKLRGNRRQAAEKKAGQIDQLARRLASGEEVSECSVEAALTACGYSLEELESAVESWRKRFGIAPLLAEEARLREQLQHTHDALPGLDAELKALEQRVRQARQDAVNAHTQIDARLSQIAARKRELEAASRDQVTVNRLKAARSRLAELESNLRALRSQAVNLEAQARRERIEIAEIDARRGTLNGQALSASDDRRSHLDRVARGHEHEIREIETQLTALTRDESLAREEVGTLETQLYAVQ